MQTRRLLQQFVSNSNGFSAPAKNFFIRNEVLWIFNHRSSLKCCYRGEGPVVLDPTGTDAGTVGVSRNAIRCTSFIRLRTFRFVRLSNRPFAFQIRLKNWGHAPRAIRDYNMKTYYICSCIWRVIWESLMSVHFPGRMYSS